MKPHATTRTYTAIPALALLVVVLAPGMLSAQGGVPLGPEFRVNSYTTSYQSSPSVASDSAINFVVVWASGGQDGSNSGIFGQRYASTGAPVGGEFRVNSYTTSYQSSPSVASDSAGNFVVAWSSTNQDGSDHGIFAQRYASMGTPLGGEFRVNSYTTAFQAVPSVASDSAGNFVVVWVGQFQDGSLSGIFAQRYAGSGTPLGAEFRVNSLTVSTQTLPSVASDSAGNFVVAWQSYFGDGNSYGVFAQRYASSGSPLGAEFRVNAYTTDDQWFPDVASDSAGNFVVIWHSDFQDGHQAGVFAQRYANTGTPLGGEFRVNTYTTWNQGIPDVASDSAGRFVVAWQDATQDSGPGIFAQRYSMIVPVELQDFRIE